MVAGKAAPGDSAGVERLKTYWAEGPGAARIGWGTDGDWARCIVNIQEAVSKHGAPLPDRMIKGLCAELHQRATGARPGHAPGESAGKH